MSGLGTKPWYTLVPQTGLYPRPRPIAQGSFEVAGRGDQDLFTARLDIFDCGLNLGPHGTERELSLGQVFLRLLDGHGLDRPLLRRAVVQEDPFDPGQDDKKVDLDLPGDQAGYIILVDDGLNSREQAAAADDDRNPSSAGSDYDPAGADEGADDPLGGDINGLGGGHDLPIP